MPGIALRLVLLEALPALAGCLAFTFRRRPRMAASLTAGALAGSVLLAWSALPVAQRLTPGLYSAFSWLTAGPLRLEFGVGFDTLSAGALAVAATVAWLILVDHAAHPIAVHPASQSGLAWPAAGLALGTALVFGLLLAPNLFQAYVFGELLGFGLLAVARRAFFALHTANLFLLFAVLSLNAHAHALDYLRLTHLAPHLAPAAVRPAALLLLAGTAGWSAQFPFHAWLLEAVKLPAPLAALLHLAAGSGVYLLARVFRLFTATAGRLPLLAVTGLGALGAAGGAAAAAAQDDPPRLLVYSTVSQMGFVLLGLGAAAPRAAVFHLAVHVSVKTLLVLGTAVGRRCRPFPLAVGTLALAGLPPFSGFFSGRAILGAVLGAAGRSPWYGMAGLLAGLAWALTAFYAARLYCRGRGAGRTRPEAASAGLPAGDTALFLLAIPAAVLGYFGRATFGVEHVPALATLLSALLATAGLLAGWLLRARRGPARGPDFALALHARWGEFLFRRPALALKWFDRLAIGGAVRGLAGALALSGRTLRRVQSGQVQRYLLYLAGAVFLALALWLWLPVSGKGQGVAGW